MMVRLGRLRQPARRAGGERAIGQPHVMVAERARDQPVVLVAQDVREVLDQRPAAHLHPWAETVPGSIDPVKEVAAAQARVDMGISTLQAESQAYDGVDWESKHKQAVREAEARRAAGLSVPGEAAPAAAAAPPADAEADAEDPPAPPQRRPARAGR